jgi:hypothetical protein
LLLVDVSEACDSNFTRTQIKTAKWADKVQEQFTPLDLIEPMAGKTIDGKVVRIYGPDANLPFQAKENEVSYLLVPFKGEKDKNKLIAKYVEAACFED